MKDKEIKEFIVIITSDIGDMQNIYHKATSIQELMKKLIINIDISQIHITEL